MKLSCSAKPQNAENLHIYVHNPDANNIIGWSSQAYTTWGLSCLSRVAGFAYR